MGYYIDYIDYFISNRDNEKMVFNLEKRLKFDILASFPEKLIFTLTGALLEESSNILMKYDIFWKLNHFGIAFDRKHSSIEQYLKQKLNMLENDKSLDLENNHEYKIYTSKHTNIFIDYLTSIQPVKRKKGYVVHRTSDASDNYRILFRDKIIENMSEIYREYKPFLTHREYNDMINKTLDLSNNKKFLFQRSIFFNEIEAEFPKIKNSTLIYDVADITYNNAMALSSNTIILSKQNFRINGIGLMNFTSNLDNEFFLRIQSLSPYKLYLLARERSWQLFVDEINELFVDLVIYKKITQNTDFVKYVHNNIALKNLLSQATKKIIDYFVKSVILYEPTVYAHKDYFNYQAEIFLDNKLSIFSKYYHHATEINNRYNNIKIILSDIINDKY